MSMLLCSISALLLRAIECRAAGLDDAAHPFGAVAAGAGLALAAVDRPAVLEIAKLAIGLHIVAQRGAAGFDRLVEHRADRRDQPFGPTTADRPGEPSRRQARAIERLADIDVTEPG